MTENQKIITNDISRYKKNKLAANLALLGLVFNCLYFMLLYGIKSVHTEFDSLRIGFSVILTLVFLLATFLASEGVKGYNKKFSIVLLVLAVWQIFRIFGYPLYGLKNELLTVNYFWLDLKYDPETGEALNTAFVNTSEFIILVVYLCASAACLIASAIIGWTRAVQLEKFQKQLDAGEISVEKTLKAMDAEDEAAAQARAEAQSEEVQ